MIGGAMRLFRWFMGLSRDARWGVLASVCWMALILTVAFHEAGGYHDQYPAGASFGKVLIFGSFPVLVGWLLHWLKGP